MLTRVDTRISPRAEDRQGGHRGRGRHMRVIPNRGLTLSSRVTLRPLREGSWKWGGRRMYMLQCWGWKQCKGRICSTEGVEMCELLFDNARCQILFFTTRGRQIGASVRGKSTRSFM
jgi:hypothetical protein